MKKKLGRYRFNERVLITDTKHPWSGNAGQLTGEVIPATNQYVIELDNGMKAAAKEYQFMPMADITVGGGSEENR